MSEEKLFRIDCSLSKAMPRFDEKNKPTGVIDYTFVAEVSLFKDMGDRFATVKSAKMFATGTDLEKTQARAIELAKAEVGL